MHRPTDCGVDASNVDVVGSTPTRCAIFSRLTDFSTDPAKVGCGGSTPLREANTPFRPR
jgi:hypothetical protein